MHSSACFVFMRTNDIDPQSHRRVPVSNRLVLGSGDTTSHSVKIFCSCVRKLQNWGGRRAGVKVRAGHVLSEGSA